MALSKIKNTGITDSSVTSAKILDGTIVNADVNASAAIASTKIACSVATSDIDRLEQNIGLLGFKMAVNDGLTVFNLVDGVVDEFHDESGTDEAEGSNDTYCATSDFYINSTSPSGVSATGSVESVAGTGNLVVSITNTGLTSGLGKINIWENIAVSQTPNWTEIAA